MKSKPKSSTRTNETYFLVYKGVDREKLALECEIKPFNDELAYLQNLVGGYLEHYTISKQLDDLHIDMWIDEEGKLKDGLKPTWALADLDGKLIDIILGNCVFSKYNDQGETLGLCESDLDIVRHFLQISPIVEIVPRDPELPRELALMSKGD